MPDTRSVLVFEPECEGHPKEWLQHLIRFAASEDRGCNLHLVVAEALYRDLVADQHEADMGHVRLIAMRPREQALCRHRSLFVSSFARWWLMRRYMARTGAEAGHFLSIDHLTLPLALGFGFGGRSVSGILFRPSNHYSTLGPYRPALIERVRDLRKDILYRLALRNPWLHKLLTLDPYFPSFATRRYAGGDKVAWLPDPVHPAVNARPSDHGIVDAIPPDLTVLLFFGHITERKGILVLLAALSGLRPEIASAIGIVIAGRIDEAVRPKMTAALAALAIAQPALWIRIADRRLESGELYALVERSDLVLAPYQRFVGSSGVLLWAARAGKPLLTQDFGLLGRLVRDRKLGFVANTCDANCLRVAIENAVRGGLRRDFDDQSARNLLATMTPQRFAAGVFSSLLSA